MRITAPAGTRLTNQQAISLRSALGRLADGQRMRPAARAGAEGLAGTRPGGARKLGSFSVLLRKRDAVEATRSQLRRMRDLIGQTTGPVTEADKESIRESFREANAAFRRTQSAGFGRELLREFAVAGPAPASLSRAGISASIRGSGEFIIGTTTTDGRDRAAVVADDRGTLELGGQFDGNSLVSVVRSGAAQTAEFRLTKTTGNNLELENLITGDKEAIVIAGIVDQAGTKVFAFDQLGVTITLSGPGESTNNVLLAALENHTIGSVTVGSTADGNTVTGITLTGVAAGTIFTLNRKSGSKVELQNTVTGAKQTVDVTNIATQTGSKLIDFDRLGVKIDLTGGVESSTDALAKALHERTIVARAVTILREFSQVTVTSTTTGQSETVFVSDATLADGSRLLNFDTLGVTLGIGSEASADLDGALAKLQGTRVGGRVREAAEEGSGRTVALFGEEEDAGSISVEALAKELDAALQQAEQEALALRTEIRTATRELGLAPGTSSVDPEFNSAAVAAEILTASPALLLGHVALGSQAALRLLAP